MPSRRQILYLLLGAASLFVILEAVMMPPEMRPPEMMRTESRAVVDEQLVAGSQRPDLSVRRAAQQQWNLAEYHFQRGEWDAARREYRRLIDQFPYTELDYGYRSDDARKRLEQIRILTTDTAAAVRINPNLPLSGD